MYYFRRFPDFSTATAAAPDDDPDGDGRSNREKYLQQSHPQKANRPYMVGEIWDLEAIHQRGLSFQPDRDTHGNDVWFYLYRIGKHPHIPHDGQYHPCPTLHPDAGYAGKLAHLSPDRDEKFSSVHGWIACQKGEDGSWELVLRPRRNVVTVLG